ncbi:SH3 domain-containing protein [Fennellomyces sp. T-0311]|nr:SH3 domain-containing protein [Fennellomyces sp. T-0311]
MSGTFLDYRMALLTLLAISIALLHGQIDGVLPVARFNSAAYDQGGAGAYAAGYIIIIIIQFLWVFVFGSEPNSYLGQFVHGWSAMNNSVENHQTEKPRHVQQQPAMQMPQPQQFEDKTMVPDQGFSPVAYEMQAHPAASSPQQSPTQEPAGEYKERVEALHDYVASTDDPSELSFRKGEVLEIVERKGNWWQARKADGSVGIIPSNYFA